MKRASLEKLGRKEVKRTEVWQRRMDIVTKLNVFQRQYLRKGFLKVINMGRVLARIWRHKALGICPTQRLRIRRQVAEMLRRRKVLHWMFSWTLSTNLRFHRLAAWLDLVLGESGVMTCRRLGGGRFSTQGLGRRFEDLRLLSGVQSEMWTSNGPIGTCLILEILLLDNGTTSPSDIKERLVKSAKLLRWKKKQIDDTEYGMWSEPITTF